MARGWSASSHVSLEARRATAQSCIMQSASSPTSPPSPLLSPCPRPHLGADWGQGSEAMAFYINSIFLSPILQPPGNLRVEIPEYFISTSASS